MDEQEMVAALADCLEALRSGEEDLNMCLERYAEHRRELVALLDVVREIRRLGPALEPSPALRQRVRRQVLATAANGRGHGGSGELNPHLR